MKSSWLEFWGHWSGWDHRRVCKLPEETHLFLWGTSEGAKGPFSQFCPRWWCAEGTFSATDGPAKCETWLCLYSKKKRKY